MPIGRPTKPLNVTSEENGKLAMQGRRLHSASRSPRADLLTCAEGLSNGELLRNCRSPRLLFVKGGNVSQVDGLEGTRRAVAKRSALDSGALVEDAVARTKTL